MNDISVLELLISFFITWAIGLTPPLLIRYVLLRRPISRWPAIGMAGMFWFLNVVLFAAMGSTSKTHAVLLLIAWVSFAILRRNISEIKVDKSNIDSDNSEDKKLVEEPRNDPWGRYK